MKKMLIALIFITTLASFSYPANDVLIPLASGKTMTCQFINNSGTYADSRIYVLCYGQNSSNQMCYLDQNGNMVPLVAGQNLSSFSYPLSSFSGFQFPPTMISVRLYVSLGSPLSMNINPGTPVGVAAPDINNPSDPNINIPFDWIELNLQNNTIFCNTSQVDMFGIPLVMTLYDNAAGGGYTVNGEVGITETAAAIMSEFAANVPSQFQSLETPIRIIAPIHGSFGSGGANANYLSSYIASVWNEYKSSPCVIQMGGKTYSGTVNSSNQLSFTTPGDSNTYLVNYPSDQDVWQGAGTMAETTNPGNGQITSVELALEAIICASFHRHVMDNTANINTTSAYYQSAPYDYYAQFWHIHSINGAAYGFCYDDVNTQSSTMVSTNPRGIVLAIGGGTYTAPTATPTPAPQPVWRVNCGGPQYTDTLGNTWAADEGYSGGTQAAPSTNTITGALPGAADQALYQTQRYGNPFTYAFNVPAGSYQVTMKFAETYWTAAGDRVFNVSINGNQVLTNFDIFKDSNGENMADDKVFTNISPNAGGQIAIQFGPAGADNAMVNAIQIIPMPSTPTPTFTPTTVAPVCASWITNGSAFISGKGVTLTTAVNSQAGSAWNTAAINLGQDFNMTFMAYFGAAGGADGIDFVLQKDSRGTTALGFPGGDKGYAGAPGITPSVAFDLETYGSNGTLQVLENGNTTSMCGYAGSACPYVFPSNVANGTEHTYQVVWNAAAKTLTLIFDGNVVMVYNRDLINAVFGGGSSVYYGFTAATGGSNNLQYVYETGCAMPTFTCTPASTLTQTATLLSSMTSTLSATPTITATFTPSVTSTNIPTGTPTMTMTFTGISTATQSFTNTYTNTPANTITRTPTSIITSLNTATITPSTTQTASWTGTYTASRTPSATQTVTGTFSRTPVLTFTITATPTETQFLPTATPTYTSSPVPVISATTTMPSATATYTATGVPTASIKAPVIYPNPSNGTAPVHMLAPLTAPADVTVEIFTVSYRKISARIFKNVAPGTPVLISPINGGTVPASGLYYVLVGAQGNRWVAILSILH